MSKSVFTKVPRITARDREIYEKVAIEGLSQRLVAGEHKVSQPRVSAIVKRVRKWLEHPVPKGLDEAAKREERLRGASRAHRMRLAFYRHLAMEAFRESQKPHTVKMVFDGEKKLIKEERVGKSAGGNLKCVEYACKFDQLLMAFDGLDGSGEVDLEAKDRLPEVDPLSDADAHELLMQMVEELLPKWEAWRTRRRGGNEKGKMEIEKCKMSDGIRAADLRRPEQGTTQFRQEAVRTSAIAIVDVNTSMDAFTQVYYVGASTAVNESSCYQAETAEKNAKLLSEPLSPIGAANHGIEATSRAVIGAEVQPLSALSREQGTGVFGVRAPAMMDNRSTPKTPVPRPLPVPGDIFRPVRIDERNAHLFPRFHVVPSKPRR